MRITVIGGGGVRTPLLVDGLTQSDLPIREIALYDPDLRRLELIAAVARHFGRGAAIRLCDSSAEAIEGAEYVFTTIRVGGVATRAHDETVAVEHGVIGQETIGPAGFAMAMRNIPHLVAYAGEIERLAPAAWIINFTNPVGIVTQAVRAATKAKIIGICDTPTELFEDVARALGLDSSACYFDYFGLNHLGWLREVYVGGDPQLQRLWDRSDVLASIYRAPLFDADSLRSLRLLPTEYLYFYYRAKDAWRNMKASGRTRGRTIEMLNDELFRQLAESPEDAPSIYERYLAVRSAGYLEIESGSSTRDGGQRAAALTGYDKIALAVVRAIHFNTAAVIPLNVANRGNIPELQADDVVEVPCMVTSNGPRALHVGPAPSQVRDLLIKVKEYERMTVDAALTRSPELARLALARHPLIQDETLAGRLMAALGLAC
jgi:6-phospho-beta-glucosidase